MWAKAHDQGVADGARIDPYAKPFDVIGQHLFGEDAFGASVTEVDDMPVVQIDIRGYPTIPDNPDPTTVISIFDSDTCQTRFQVIIGGLSEPIIIEDNFFGSPPKPCQEPGRNR